jgi:hypothetical protein
MVKESFDTKNIKGWLKIIGIDAEGNEHILVDRKNALVANATTIIANVLGGTSNFALDTIAAYQAGTLLASQGVTINFPTPEQVQYTTLFSTTSFNATLDELRLSSAAGGEFSAVTGLSVYKSNLLQLSVQWLLTVF